MCSVFVQGGVKLNPDCQIPLDLFSHRLPQGHHGRVPGKRRREAERPAFGAVGERGPLARSPAAWGSWSGAGAASPPISGTPGLGGRRESPGHQSRSSSSRGPASGTGRLPRPDTGRLTLCARTGTLGQPRPSTGETLMAQSTAMSARRPGQLRREPCPPPTPSLRGTPTPSSRLHDLGEARDSPTSPGLKGHLPLGAPGPLPRK